jgi:lysyl-tRNA synthetase class 2
LTERTESRRAIAARLLSIGLAVVAVLGIVSSLTPRLRSRAEVINSVVPESFSEVATVLALAISVMLLIVAGGLRRRRRRAWQAAVCMLTGVALMHVVKGLDFEEAAASLLLLLGLVVYRDAFDIEGDPETPATFRRHALLAVGGLVVMSILLIELQSLMMGDTLSPIQWSSEFLHSVAGLGPDRLEGRGAHAVPRAIVVFTLAAAAWLTFLWLKPRRQYVQRHAVDRADARRIVESCGSDTLDYFALRQDKDYFFSPGRTAVIGYRVAGGVALISGDPIGPPGCAVSLLTAFREHARRHDWRVAAIGVGKPYLEAYEAAGLRTLYIGDEAIVDPRTFSLEGRHIRKVRQSVSRLEKAGYSAIVRRRSELTPELLAGLLRVSRLWLGGQPERGFSMAMDDLWAEEHGSAVFVIGIGDDGRPHGFIHFVPVPMAHALSLSAMRRLPETPNGLMEYLLCEAFAWGRDHDVYRVSLNFNAFGELLRSESADLGPWERTMRWSLGRADRYFQVERLLSFNRKFFPEWQPRYAAFEQRRDLPLAAIVTLTSESLVDVPGPLVRLYRRVLPRRATA